MSQIPKLYVFNSFDPETTGLAPRFTMPHSDWTSCRRLVNSLWQLHDAKGNLLSNHSILSDRKVFTIPDQWAEKVLESPPNEAWREGHDSKTEDSWVF